MRLLQHSSTGEFSFTKDLVGDDRIPPYAILSHTWGSDTDEVTFEDLTNGIGKHKAGYEKIRFCGEQARQDGLQYFWIDTCCINRANYTELSQAINSMFRWYHDATRCYVYLPDVSSPAFDTNEEFDLRQWESDFQKSRWFKRGWTLQELLAPSSVEFFSRERWRLGDKRSLRQQIHEITGIADSALQGAYLSQFSVDERLTWIDRRQTKLEEDKAYSLLGIFDVSMPLIYGEGEGKAFKRLREEIDRLLKSLPQRLAPVQLGKEDQECIQQLRLTDPRDDKKRIEETKGGLLEDSYHRILENSDFQQWCNDRQSHLLWIKGDPGNGKTMLLCGIVNELKKSMARTDLLSYFFCQATDPRISNATAVLRGLVFLLVHQQPSLISHVRAKHDHAGKTLFEDANAWYALSEIFTNILQDPSLNSTYLIIDALDECVKDLPKLLDLIVQKSSVSPRVKWIVSSRNWPDIEERLEMAGHKVRLCLELNAESISTAVSIYIRHKVLQLAQRKKYDDKTRDAVLDYLFSNANDNFLRVALVCQNLEKFSRSNTLVKLNAFPPGLDSLCARMVEQIYNPNNADLCNRDGTPDLYCIKCSNTEAGNLEVHILNGADNYQSFLLQTGTPITEADAGANFLFAVVDFRRDGTPDLYCIKCSNTGTGNLEVHILSGADNYQSFLLQTGTPITEADAGANFLFALGDFNHDGTPDLYCIKRSNTGTGNLEVHILSGADNYQSFLLHTGTPITQADAANFLFAVGDFNHDGLPDLYYLKRLNTGTNKLEVHILNGGAGY
jgi:hypothetical protein